MPKKTLLVVAPGLPDFDRHAGSRRLYSWLRILATEYDVAFHILQSRIVGESRRYAEALRVLGIEIYPAQDTSLKLLARRIDHGVLFEFFHTAERMLPHLRLLPPGPADRRLLLGSPLCSRIARRRLCRNGLEHARARWDSSEVARRLLETMARLPTLTPKRLGAMDRARIRSRATSEASGFDASVGRLSSLLRWYYLRLARARLPGHSSGI